MIEDIMRIAKNMQQYYKLHSSQSYKIAIHQ